MGFSARGVGAGVGGGAWGDVCVCGVTSNNNAGVCLKDSKKVPPKIPRI